MMEKVGTGFFGSRCIWMDKWEFRFQSLHEFKFWLPRSFPDRDSGGFLARNVSGEVLRGVEGVGSG